MADALSPLDAYVLFVLPGVFIAVCTVCLVWFIKESGRRHRRAGRDVHGNDGEGA